jgi:hypothetical protein
MDHRQIVRMLACARMAVGVTLLVAPARGGSLWIGPWSRDRAAKMVIRSAAARDLALGMGTYQALAEGSPVRPWVLAGVISDGVDAVATIAAIRQVGARRALPVIVAAAASAAYAASVADQLDPA